MKNMRVLGMDILPSRDKFYGVIIDEYENKLWEGYLTREEITKIIRAYRVSKIAIDNVFELYPSQNELISFLRRTKIKLIQVTGGPRHMRKISQIATEVGLWKGGKLSPKDTAKIAALLALRGYGAEVSIFDELTEIIISRTRSLGEGGQHQSKYARVIAAAIQSAEKEIESKLNSANLKYDVFKHEGDFGLKSARIIVYAPHNEVRSFIKEYFGPLFRIEIKPFEKQRLVFLSKCRGSKKNRYVICGIDPGETIAIAILDLNGKLVRVTSKKFMSISEIIEEIYSVGKPIIISTDVPKTPQLIDYLASKTGALVIKPKTILSNQEKTNLVNELGVDVANVHERDALVAAYLAFSKYKQVFQRIDKILSYIPIYLNADLVKRDVILGYSIKDSIRRHFWAEIDKILDVKANTYKSTYNNREKSLIDEINKLSKKLADSYEERNRLNQKISQLQNEILTKNSEIDRLKEQIDRLKVEKRKVELEELKRLGFSRIKELEDENRSLRSALKRLRNQVEFLWGIINQLKEINNAIRNGMVVIKTVNTLTMDEVIHLENLYGLAKQDTILIRSWNNFSFKALKYIVNKGIQNLVVPRELPQNILTQLEKFDISLIFLEDFDHELDINNDVILLKSKELYRAKRKALRRNMSEIDAMYDLLEEVISESRTRKKEIQAD